MSKSKSPSKARKDEARATGAGAKVAAGRGEAHARASAATLPEASRKGKHAPVSTDIRRRYMKSLLGDYMGTHRGAAAIKPKK
jgi:hypothetical protein